MNVVSLFCSSARSSSKSIRFSSSLTALTSKPSRKRYGFVPPHAVRDALAVMYQPRRFAQREHADDAIFSIVQRDQLALGYRAFDHAHLVGLGAGAEANARRARELNFHAELIGPKVRHRRERLAERWPVQQAFGRVRSLLHGVRPVLDAPAHATEPIRPARDVARRDDVRHRGRARRVALHTVAD